MSDEDALLAAMRERPHDETPRLVYADWLDDSGDPEHAHEAAYHRGVVASRRAMGLTADADKHTRETHIVRDDNTPEDERARVVRGANMRATQYGGYMVAGASGHNVIGWAAASKKAADAHAHAAAVAEQHGDNIGAALHHAAAAKHHEAYQSLSTASGGLEERGIYIARTPGPDGRRRQVWVRDGGVYQHDSGKVWMRVVFRPYKPATGFPYSARTPPDVTTPARFHQQYEPYTTSTHLKGKPRPEGAV